ncbi:MAG TPA: hypothetical protein EYM79_11225 [Planctomycetes bacterium]|nr:hypothetical protein [Planctomycetota bacterium]
MLSTEQEIEVVDRLVEAVAVEMEQIDGTPIDSLAAKDEIKPTIMDIGELVERAMEESRGHADEEQYDEIEIIDEDECEMDIIDSDDQDADRDWHDEDWDGDDIEDEDGIAA